MTRRLGFWLGLCCLLCAPALALAQDDDDDDDIFTNTTGGLGVQLLFVEGVSYNEMQQIPIGKRACDENQQLHFRVNGLSTGLGANRYLEFWTGNNCNTSDRKNSEEGNDCVRIDYIERNRSQPFEEPKLNMVDLCESDGNVKIWFLPVDSLDTNENVSTYGLYELVLDLSPPDAPSNVRSQAGETEIPIDWTASGTNISKNYLIWDPSPTQVNVDEDAGVDGGSGDAPCASPHLTPGEAFDLSRRPIGIRVQEVDGEVDHATIDGRDLGSAYVALVIVTEDLAGNISPMSNVTCVKVVPTDGFWDSVDGYEQGCACSIPGSRTSPLAALPVAIALLVIRIRRKRRS